MEAIVTQDGARPWRGAAAAVPLRCWEAGQLAGLSDAVQAALSSWQQAWGLAGSLTSACTVATAASLVGQDWTPLRFSGEIAAWLHAPKAAAMVATALFGDLSSAAVASEVVEACVADGWKRLAGVLQLAAAPGSTSVPASADVAPWSGAVEVVVTGVVDARLVLAPEVVEAWCASRGFARSTTRAGASQPLAAASDAVAQQMVSLQVQLVGCELDLGSLQELQVGDVLRLPHPLEAPARVLDGTGATLFGGYLGRHLGQLAVELVKNPSP
ncbi:FliM/FliN family flagellar motor switch protein [Ramlibacter pallidus]|uniref:FliM/FliN family flagellar motor switch protein n=1 Tax=Ramlibacter pallidus TaxID=2780087 RepID=A0ABR9S119_9BURK|nr:FliM/FliN family flagellar motor C-terminal domain-containing protein [Ramlibacter pallidus]MBE7367186.1 FliM/FliN family flagellar motor switch protein [Ramlibacter pallidus]